MGWIDKLTFSFLCDLQFGIDLGRCVGSFSLILLTFWPVALGNMRWHLMQLLLSDPCHGQLRLRGVWQRQAYSGRTRGNFEHSKHLRLIYPAVTKRSCNHCPRMRNWTGAQSPRGSENCAPDPPEGCTSSRFRVANSPDPGGGERQRPTTSLFC